MEKKRITQEELDNAVVQHNKYTEDNTAGARAVFEDTIFDSIDMSDKQLNSASFKNCYFRNCNMADTGLCFAEIKDCLFDRCNAKLLVAEEAAISNTTFENCNMSKAYFTHSGFDNTRFVGCDMEGSSFQNAFGSLDIIPEREKPKCKLVGSDGNIFVLLGIASSALKKNDQREDAENMRERVYASQNYYEALGIITEYVDDESMSEDYDESDDISM